jgi:hypothetical protein
MTIDVVVIGAVVIGAVAAVGPIAAARERIDLGQATSRAPYRSASYTGPNADPIPTA